MREREKRVESEKDNCSLVDKLSGGSERVAGIAFCLHHHVQNREGEKGSEKRRCTSRSPIESTDSCSNVDIESALFLQLT